MTESKLVTPNKCYENEEQYAIVFKKIQIFSKGKTTFLHYQLFETTLYSP